MINIPYKSWHLSGCHRHSNLCGSLLTDSSGRIGFQQHEEQSHGDMSDTGQVWGPYSACMSCHKAHSVPAIQQFH